MMVSVGKDVAERLLSCDNRECPVQSIVQSSEIRPVRLLWYAESHEVSLGQNVHQ